MHVRFLLIALVLTIILPASESIASDTPDPLNSYVNRPATCKLKQGEREWLMNAMKRGDLRLATTADKQAWEALAKKKKRPNTKFYLDCGRTYTILKFLVIPGEIANERVSGHITFILDKGVPFPHLRNSGSAVYDLNTGGWYQIGHYDDGSKQGVGVFPTSTQKR